MAAAEIARKLCVKVSRVVRRDAIRADHAVASRPAINE
jgi:hypothetical protein